MAEVIVPAVNITFNGSEVRRTFFGLTPNASHVMSGLVEGTGSLTTGRTTSILVKDQDTGYYGSLSSGISGFENGRIDTNVVYDTDTSGNEFASVPYLRVTKGATNSCLQNKFASGWSTVGTATLTVNQPGIDGSSNTGASVACTSGVFADYIQYNMSLTSLPSAVESSYVIWVKKKASQTNDAFIWVRFVGGTTATNYGIYLNTTTGTLSNPSGGPTSYYSDLEEINGEDYWKVTLSATESSVPTPNNNAIPRFSSGAGETCIVLSPMLLFNTPGAVARFVQPIITSATAVTQGTDTYSYSSDNLNSSRGSIYFEVNLNGDDNILNGFLYRSSGNLILDDGTTTVSTPVNIQEWLNVGLAWDDTDEQMDLYVNGAWIGAVAYDGSLLSGSFDLFRSVVYGGKIRGLQIYYEPIHIISTGANVESSAVNIALAVNTPIITANNANIEVGSINIQLAVNSPVITTGASVTVPSVNIGIAVNTPTIASGANVVVPSVNIAIAATEPVLNTGTRVIVGSKNISLSTLSPTINTGAAIVCPAVNVTITPVIPVVEGGTITRVNVPVANISLSGNSPSIQTGVNIVIGSVGITISGNVPIISTIIPTSSARQIRIKKRCINYKTEFSQDSYDTGFATDSYFTFFEHNED